MSSSIDSLPISTFTCSTLNTDISLPRFSSFYSIYFSGKLYTFISVKKETTVLVSLILIFLVKTLIRHLVFLYRHYGDVQAFLHFGKSTGLEFPSLRIFV